MPPASVRTLRSATDTDEPITESTRVVSVVSRDSTSPVITRSKKPGLSPTTRS